MEELFSQQEEQVDIRVTQALGKRSLWMNSVEQSQMRVNLPTQLITPYEQVMATWQLFIPQGTTLNQIVMFGLGGGSAAKHAMQHHTNAKVQIIEISDTVAYLAYQFFALPKRPQLTVLIEDAMNWVAQPQWLQQDAADLLYIDLFNYETQRVYRFSQDFFERCLAGLSTTGVLAINLWAEKPEEFKAVLQKLGEVFSWRVLILPVADSSNVIVFAFHPNGTRFQLASLIKTAQRLNAKLELPITNYLKELSKHNQATIHFCLADD